MKILRIINAIDPVLEKLMLRDPAAPLRPGDMDYASPSGVTARLTPHPTSAQQFPSSSAALAAASLAGLEDTGDVEICPTSVFPELGTDVAPSATASAGSSSLRSH